MCLRPVRAGGAVRAHLTRSRWYEGAARSAAPRRAHPAVWIARPRCVGLGCGARLRTPGVPHSGKCTTNATTSACDRLPTEAGVASGVVPSCILDPAATMNRLASTQRSRLHPGTVGTRGLPLHHSPQPRCRTLRARAQQQHPNDEQGRPVDSTVMMQTLTSVHKLAGRAPGRSNLVLAGDGNDDTWRALDQKVNKYPGQRTFTAIGSGGAQFREAMVSAVQSVVGQVHQECVRERASSGGRYTSVTVGPVWVQNGDQVLAIYAAMRQDERLRWFI